MMKNLIADLNAHTTGSSKRSKLITLLISVGFSCMFIFRVQSYLYKRKLIFLAYQLHRYNLAVHGADFMPGCEIGPGLRIEHPAGIVIGAGVVIGNSCTILQGTTIGSRDSRSKDLSNKFPRLGDNVKIGANSTILGEVQIGSNSIIGAHSLVLKSTAENSTIMGLWS